MGALRKAGPQRDRLSKTQLRVLDRLYDGERLVSEISGPGAWFSGVGFHRRVTIRTILSMVRSGLIVKGPDACYRLTPFGAEARRKPNEPPLKLTE